MTTKLFVEGYPSQLQTVPTEDNEIVLQYMLGYGFGSWAISYRGYEWSHVDVVDKQGWLTGARNEVNKDSRTGKPIPAGVQRRPPDYTQKKHALRILIRTKRAPDFYKWVADQIGKPYDNIAIWDFITGKSDDRDWRNPKAWFCDEMVLSGLEQINNWPKPLYIPADSVDVGGSLLAISAGPSFSELERF